MHILLTCSCSSTPSFAKHFVAKKFKIPISDIQLYVGISQYKVAMSQFPVGSPVRTLFEAKMQRTHKYAYYFEADEAGSLLKTLDVLKGVPISV